MRIRSNRMPRMPLTVEETGEPGAKSREFVVSTGQDGRSLAELKLPGGALVLLIRREERFVIPRGDTSLAAGDVLTVMGSERALEQCEALLNGRESG